MWFYNLKYYKLSFLGIKQDLPITADYVDSVRKAARYVSYLICALMLFLIIVEHDLETQ